MSAIKSEETTLMDSEKTCFDYCKEGSLNKLKEFLSKAENKKESINQTDENQMSLLMWACDRGNLELVEYLVESGVDVNLQDSDGQSSLHYAASCDHTDIVKFLLKNEKINIDLLDSDGLRASESSDNKQIIELFNQMTTSD